MLLGHLLEHLITVGTLRVTDAGRLVADGVVVVPGVRVTGRERRGGVLRLVVTGADAARGRVAISERGRLSGRLGGVRVTAALSNRPPRPFGLFSAAASSTPVAARP
jgi:hypothetical protein